MNARSTLLQSFAAVVLACGALFAGSVQAAEVPVMLAQWDIELTSMDLNASRVQLPLGPGWGAMLTNVHLGEAAGPRSTGRMTASRLDAQLVGPIQDGEPVLVQSFFDVFFEIRITDADPSLDFPGLSDGASLSFLGVGAGRIANTYQATVDRALPNWGLFPPAESAPLVGALGLEVALGADFNANGENDKLKLGEFSLLARSANRSFIVLPDGTVIDSFDAAADLSGAVVDASQDPPFGPFTLTGPTTAQSRLTGDNTVPEPASLGLLAFGLALAGLARRRWPPSRLAPH